MIDRIIQALSEPTIAIVRMVGKWDGYYSEGKVRINKHSRRPYERTLIHEMLHHLYPDKTEQWVVRNENKLWLSMTRLQLRQLRAAIRRIHRGHL